MIAIAVAFSKHRFHWGRKMPMHVLRRCGSMCSPSTSATAPERASALEETSTPDTQMIEYNAGMAPADLLPHHQRNARMKFSEGTGNKMNEGKRLPQDFVQALGDLEASYLAETDPVRQSGFLGGHERWKKERSLILEAVDRDGDFLDVGCANGYLIQCLCQWALDRGVSLTPYGVDQGTGLIELARKRLPEYASHFWVANAWDWVPPRKFTYTYTMTDFVPEQLLKDYLTRAMTHYVSANGRLIVGAYGSYSRNTPARDIAGLLSACGFAVAGSATCGSLPVSHVAWVDAGQFASPDAPGPD